MELKKSATIPISSAVHLGPHRQVTFHSPFNFTQQANQLFLQRFCPLLLLSVEGLGFPLGLGTLGKQLRLLHRKAKLQGNLAEEADLILSPDPWPRALVGNQKGRLASHRPKLEPLNLPLPGRGQAV